MPRKNIGKNSLFSGRVGDNKHKHQLAPRRKLVPKYLIRDEINVLLSVIKNPRDQAIFRVAYHHGLRAREIGAILMSDYRPGRRAENDYLMIERLKGSIGGDTLLVPAAAHALRQWVKKRGPKSGPIFNTRQKGPITQQRLDQLMKHYCKLAEIPPEKAHFHALKHTCATILLSEEKLSIVDVQHHLGHKNIQSTMIYAELTEQANQERAARLKNWK